MTATLENPYAPPSDERVQAGPPRGWKPPKGLRPREPRSARLPFTDGARALQIALVTAVALVVGVFAYLAVLTPLQEARAQRELGSQLRQELAAQTAPIGGVIDPGTPVLLLEIPTLGLRQVVVEGTAAQDLMSGPGHRRDTPLPGQRGVSLVYGRSGAYGGPFKAVPTLKKGDGIIVTNGQGEFTYRVDGVRYAGDPFPAPPAADGSRLTLVTGEGPGGSAGTLLPVRVAYVDATLVGKAAVAPPGRAGGVPESEKAMQVDPSVWPIVVLALQLLLLVVLVTAFLVRKLPGRAVWVLAVPVVVAAAWVVGDTSARLLPNLL
ncbi:class E sortase [Cellulomonas sp. URHE0023]|uniref:class E sortase n=1 Tax=Cellulomonas sp. URHE0023 TaxID=1380354 RepID=UPI00068D2635|nr:class E sortase [Cellulomonas sp. URHE0023]